MYKSPIEAIYDKAVHKILKDAEERMMCAVQQAVGYEVDKDELIKALRYDRNQYEKGFEDGIAQQTKWIPCIEQAPTTSDEYLITWTCEWNGKLIRSISIAEYDAEAEEWNTDAYIRNYSNEVGIIAWMPCPEPYKEAEDES